VGDRGLLAAQQPLVRRPGQPQIDDPVLVAPVAVLLLPHRRDHVAGNDDREILEQTHPRSPRR
jgi:hypothetical protein